MPRRYVDYPDAFAYWNKVSSIGSYISGVGVLVFLYGLIEAFSPQGAGRRQSVGRRRHDAGMDAALAAAVPPVQRTAALGCDERGRDRSTPRPQGGRRFDLSVVDPTAIGLTPRIAARRASQDYVALLKPRVMSLVVFTALAGLVVAPARASGARPSAILCIAVGAGAVGRAQHVVRRRHRRDDARTANGRSRRGRVQPADALALGTCCRSSRC